MRPLSLVLLTVGLAFAPNSGPASANDPAVEVVRLPAGGIQPDVVVDQAGVVHMVYLAGEPGAANVYYVRSTDSGKTFSRAIQVNSQDGSAIAAGAIRGAEIAVGRNGRVHVAWNGSNTALPKPPMNPRTHGSGMPMLYSRLNGSATAFEPQRNLMTQTTDLDGGGSIAADNRGNVYVAWHASPADGLGGEAARRVWVARSDDDGGRFTKERPVSDPSTGACGCCALRIFAGPGGDVHLLYRGAANLSDRDIYSLVSRDRGQTFTSAKLHEWKIPACPMTSMSIAKGKRLLGAWETDGQVYFKALDGTDPAKAPPAVVAGSEARRKHPRLTVGANGTVLLTWTEVVGRAHHGGGALAWQAFTADGQPTSTSGTRADVPALSFAAVIARPDGGFTILY